MRSLQNMREAQRQNAMISTKANKKEALRLETRIDAAILRFFDKYPNEKPGFIHQPPLL